jgi:hypothetical protein
MSTDAGIEEHWIGEAVLPRPHQRTTTTSPRRSTSFGILSQWSAVEWPHSSPQTVQATLRPMRPCQAEKPGGLLSR